jgi:hypothetical protein
MGLQISKIMHMIELVIIYEGIIIGISRGILY